MEFEGAFYDLFKLYHVAKPSVMVSHFDIPTLHFGLIKEMEYLSPQVDLIATLDEIPASLKPYLTKNEKLVGVPTKKFAVIKGSAHDVYFVMSNIRDDTSDNVLKIMHQYDAICERYDLPSMIPHLKIR